MHFSEEEYRHRVRSLQARMRDGGVEVALLTDRANIAYFAGYSPEHFFLTRSRLLVLLIPASGVPVAIAPASHARDMAEQTGIVPIGYQGLRHAPIAMIAETIRAIGAGTVGLELGFEHRVNMTPTDFDALRERLARPTLDIAAAIWSVRLAKSRAEIALIAQACRIGEQALDRAAMALRPGQTERDLAGTIAAEVSLLGGRVAFLIITSGAGEYHRSNGAPRQRSLVSGDFVFIDLGVEYLGYHADFNRNLTIGEPSDPQRALQESVRAVSEGAIRHLRPGLPVSDLYRRVLDDCRAAGLALDPPGRIGHGIGLEVTEPPHIAADDSSVLAEGMVFSIEPAVERPDGLYCAECLFAITAEGARMLNRGGSGLDAAGDVR